MSAPIITDSLLSVFTPAASCANAFTYEGPYYNSVSGGMLIRDASASNCYPSGYIPNGRIPASQIYSPGWCPDGWATPVVSTGAGTTSAVCCESHYTYYTTYSTINFFASEGSQLFAGCVSTFGSQSTTTLNARSGDSALSLTSVSGPLTMWVPPLTIQYQRKDVALFTTSTSTPATAKAASTSSPTASALVETTSAPGSPATTEATSTSSPTAPALLVATSAPSSGSSGSTKQEASNSGISTAAIAGMSTGVAIAGIALLLSAVIFWRWRRRPTVIYRGPYVDSEAKAEPMLPQEESELAYPLSYVSGRQELPDRKPRPQELDGGGYANFST